MRRSFIAVFFAFFLISPAHGADKKNTNEISSETKLALKSVSERYRKLRHWTAEFSQESYSVGLGRGTFQKGTFRFLEPNLVSFDLEEPEASSFVSNGTEAWQLKYPNGKKKAAEGYHFAHVGDLELSRYLIFLRGIDVSDPAKEKALLSEYKVSAQVDPATVVLTLEPRKNSEVSSVELHFSQSKVPPTKIVLLDAIGNTTTVNILKVDMDPKLDKKSFKPEVPRGSRIQEK